MRLLRPEPAPSGAGPPDRGDALCGARRRQALAAVPAHRIRAPVRRRGGAARSTPLPRSNACIATRSCMTTCRAMDDDAVRRGRPTAHIAFDEATAILAGDALQTLAFDILSRPRTHADAERAGRADRLAGRGRRRATAWPEGRRSTCRRGRDATARWRWRKMQAMKTGALFASPARQAPCSAAPMTGEARRFVPMPPPSARPFSSPTICSMPKATKRRSARRWPRTPARGKATLVACSAIERGRGRASGARRRGGSRRSRHSGTQAATLKDAARFIASRRA